MTGMAFLQDDDRHSAAAEWVVRLEAGVDPAEALAFDAWLQADIAHAGAFDAALQVSQAYARHRTQVIAALPQRRATPAQQRRGWLIGAAAAAAAVVVVTPQMLTPKTVIYQTARGEHREVSLADGTTLQLNGATRLSVRLAGTLRTVVLDRGEAIFDVAHNPRRPFLVAVGDQTVRVIGTQFDVHRLSGKLSVTVVRGAVEVSPTEGQGATYRLHPGQKLDHVEGQSQVRVAAVEPSEVIGWRVGRLILRDRPLGDVVDDLNQKFPVPMRIDDPQLAALPVSGVLVLDSQDAVIDRLALLAPVRAVRSDAGFVLRRDR